MFESAGKWIDSRFIGFRDWLDRKLVPQWRVWWKLRSMQLGVIFAAILTYLADAPATLTQVLNSMPQWLQNSLPTWVGPLTLAILFFTRFWDQTKAKADAAQPADPATTHGAE